MKFLVYISLAILITVLLLILFFTLRDNRIYKKRSEMMEYQISTINRLINEQNQTIKIDEQIKNESDYSMNGTGNTTYLFYSKIKSVQDFAIEVDTDNKITYIGYNKH